MKSNTVKRILALTLTFVVAIGAVPALADTTTQETDSQVQVNNVVATQKVVNAKPLDNTHIYVEFSEDVDFTTLEAATWDVKKMYGDNAVIPVFSATGASLAQTELYDSENDTNEEQVAAAKRGVVVYLNGSVQASTLYRMTVGNVKTVDGGEMSTTDNSKAFVGVPGPIVPSVYYQKVSSVKALDQNHIYVNFVEDVDFATLSDATWTVAKKYGSQMALNVTEAVQATADQTYLFDANNDTDAEKAAAVKKAVVVTVDTSMEAATLYQLTAGNVKTLAGEVMSSESSDTTKLFVGLDHALPVPAPLQKVSSVKPLDSKKVYVEFTEDINFNHVDGTNFEIREAYSAQTVSTVVSAVGATLAETALFNPEYDTQEEQVAAAKKGVVITLQDDMYDATLYKLTANNVMTLEGANMSADSSDKERNFVGIGGVQPFEILAAVAPDASTLHIYFDRALDETTVANLSNYVITKNNSSETLTVTNATFLADRNIVELTISAMEPTVYTLKTFNLLDVDGNPQKTDTTVQFAGNVN